MNEQNISQTNEPIQSSKHIWIIIIAVVITAIIVGGGVYTWKKSNLQSTEQSLQRQINTLQSQIESLQQATPSVVTNQQTTQERTQPVDETANWQTYENEELGFEFQYPKNMVIDNISQEVVDNEVYQGLDLMANELKLHFSIANTQEAYYSYHGGAPEKEISQDKKRIGQLDIEKRVVFGYQILPDGTWVLSYDFGYQNYKYKFMTWADGVVESNPIPKSTEDLMEQILSTFKFTK